MKRKIKFRAWDRSNGKWLKEFVLFNYGGIGTLTGNDAYVNNLDLMQFTGLLDKNGVEIYEGDILRTRYIETIKGVREAMGYDVEVEPGVYDFYGVVVFAEGAFRFLPTECKSWKKFKRKYPCDESMIDTENEDVIGNVHENPELLK